MLLILEPIRSPHKTVVTALQGRLDGVRVLCSWVGLTTMPVRLNDHEIARLNAHDRPAERHSARGAGAPCRTAAGERVRGLGQGATPLQQVRILNSLIIIFPLFSSTRRFSTQTLVLGPWPWPRGLFTLSARLVDGAGAGRCRMPGAVVIMSSRVFRPRAISALRSALYF